MKRIWWRLTEQMAQTLDPCEREAVIGDLSETAETGTLAMCDVLGLVVRRRLSERSNWRAWSALVGLAIPAGFAVNLGALWLARVYNLNFWILWNHRDIDPVILKDVGMTLDQGIGMMMLCSSLLIAWAWASGFVIGALSRRTVGISAGVFAALLLKSLSETSSRGSLLFAILSLLGLALVPAIFGIRLACKPEMTRLTRSALWIAAAAAIAVPSLFWWPKPLRPLEAVVCWPLGYLAATAILTRRRDCRPLIEEQNA